MRVTVEKALKFLICLGIVAGVRKIVSCAGAVVQRLNTVPASAATEAGATRASSAQAAASPSADDAEDVEFTSTGSEQPDSSKLQTEWKKVEDAIKELEKDRYTAFSDFVKPKLEKNLEETEIKTSLLSKASEIFSDKKVGAAIDEVMKAYFAAGAGDEFIKTRDQTMELFRKQLAADVDLIFNQIKAAYEKGKNKSQAK